MCTQGRHVPHESPSSASRSDSAMLRTPGLHNDIPHASQDHAPVPTKRTSKAQLGFSTAEAAEWQNGHTITALTATELDPSHPFT